MLLCLVAVSVIIVCRRLRIVWVLEVVGSVKSNVMALVVGEVDELLLLEIRSLRNHLLIHVVLHMAVVTVCAVQ